MARSENENNYYSMMGSYFNEKSCGTINEKLSNFPKFVSRQDLSRFLYKYELFKKVIDVHGSIVECGVHMGGGTYAFANLSSILEPYNYQRKIFGFDTYAGFPSVDAKDLTTQKGSEVAKVGAFNVEGDILADLATCNELYNMNRPIGHMNKVSFIKGDVGETIPQFLKDNPQLIISLLYLDFDIYKPTQVALEALIDRVPKGGIIAFDELNNEDWPGETEAVHEVVGLKNLRLQRIPFEPCRSFAIVE
ncbi:macrocin O-methyltransferase [Bacteriovoracaceae bacterium]|nr:macrocin O-methyltransferase [Bacteriovoracaceae bacterium]